MVAAARKTQLQHVHTIAKQVTPTEVANGLAGGVLVGVLPAGSVANYSRLITAQVFNSTTALLSIGTTPTGAQVAAASSVQAAVARVDQAVPVAVAGPFAVDTPIYCSIVITGPLPTTGNAVVIVEYVPHLS